MNAIYTNQSIRENLDLLYAQARVYDRVKNWNRLNFLFSIIVPLLLFSSFEIKRTTLDALMTMSHCIYKPVAIILSG
ncbi:S-4TM family putative pore-forming effector [Escherichia coli]|uniref:S-4TM family putative pore-forming effector n=1 Tax=Escherichia coli TaxID=562 RepID=UPI000D16718A|nr:S-4TM family putative pore-forming effector [Escherichia coli]PSY47345.1 hypothetical protein C7B19_24725 [Escherichia coli]